MADNSSTKICAKCRVEKPLEAFSVASRRPDGRHSRCRQCANEYAKEYRETDGAKETYQRWYEGVKAARPPKPTRQCVFCDKEIPPETSRSKFCSHECKLAHRRRDRPGWDGVERESARCAECKEWKSASEFSRNRSEISGLASYCKPCQSVRAKRFNQAKPEYRQAVGRRSRRRHRGRHLALAARRRSRDCGFPYDLDEHIEEIQNRIDAGCCEMSGAPFDLDMSFGPNTPSLDRIVPALGYVYSNIRIICFAMNCALNAWGEEPLLQIMREWVRRKDAENLRPDQREDTEGDGH